MYGFEGLLRIAGRFVGMGQAVEVVGGRVGQEMFCKCGAEERTSRNRPVGCAVCARSVCLSELLQPDLDKSTTIAESN